jgi:soluble lytic murein transglycosylase-like protein
MKNIFTFGALAAAGFALYGVVNDAKAAAAVLYDDEFQKWATKYGVDWKLLKAHAMAESSLMAGAFNPEKKGAQDGSYGLMQIYVVTDALGRVVNRLNVDNWPPAKPEALFDPDYNVQIGAQIVASNIKAWGMPRAVAVYNNFSARKSPQAGPFPNQVYVDRVLKNYRRLTA